MAFYLMQPPPGGGIVVATQQRPPDLEVLALNENDAITQALFERAPQLRSEGLVHVFLPKKTPQSVQPDLELIEATLLTSIVNCTEDVLNAYNRDFEWKTVIAMKEWRRLQLLMEYGTDVVFTTAFSNALFNLRTDQTLPLYIRKQNCTMLLTKTSKSHSSFKIETFQPSLPSHRVMTSLGSLSLPFPHTVDFTENSQLLCSPCFIQQLRDLALNDYEASMPKIQKGGQDFAETRDVPTPYLITELLIGMLVDGENKRINDTLRTVTKKVRDTVEWNSCITPFRRSGLWMSAKVILQLCLLKEVGGKDSLMIYKMIMLRLVCSLVNFRADVPPNDWDLMHQMLAKLGKRAMKFSDMMSENEDLMLIKKNLLKDAYRTVDTIQSKMSFLWNELSSKEDTISVINRSLTEFRSDLYHQIPLLDDYLRTPMLPIREEDHDGVKDIIPITRWKTFDKLIKMDYSQVKRVQTDENLDDELVWLHDVETVNIAEVDDVPSLSIYLLMKKYAERATKRYSSYQGCDPISLSRMVITLLSFYKKLDEIATEKHPLLTEYSAGIDTAILSKLLAVDGPKDLTAIDTLEGYFKKRESTAKYNSIIHQSQISKTCFSVRYAMDCEAMNKLRERIQEDINMAIERKKAEIERAKKECEGMETTLLALEHVHNLGEPATQYVKKCPRCKLTRQWNQRKLSVRIYEKPLPRETALQYALVFELLIPSEICCVRDALAYITKEVLGVEDGIADDSKISTKWLTSYRPMKAYTIDSRKYPDFVQFGSTTKPVSGSHYNTSLDIFVAPVEKFIVENGMNCLLFHVRKLKDFKIPGDPFAFQISSTNDEEKLYRNLQFAVSSTDHTQNRVIAEEHMLNSSLPPSEILAFGCLRSGHRLQLRNLYKFLSEKSLNMEREPVLAIILQTLWSAGPLEENSRPSQSEFSNPDFAAEFLKLLETLIKANSHNWSSPLILLSPVAIIIQILKFTSSEAIRTTCTLLLRKCRVIIDGWIQTVQDQLSLVPTQDPVQKENEQLFLKARILEMLISSVFTFHAGAHECEIANNYLLLSNADVKTYLKLLSGLHYYVNVEKIHEKLSPFLQILLQVARQRIPLNLESHLHRKVQLLGATATLVEFVHSNWSKGSMHTHFKSGIWKICGNVEKWHVYEGRLEYHDGKTHKVHVDIVGGAFLIDSFPPTHLPASISQEPLFQRFFGSQYGENFKVQRDATRFTTTNKINGKHYSFFEAWHDEKLHCVCRELLDEEDDELRHHAKVDDVDDNYLELLDSEVFRGVVASPFVENYTHWLNPQTKEVYFRKRQTSSFLTNNQHILTVGAQIQEPDYKLTRNSSDGNGWKLLHQTTGKHVMSVKSEGFELVSEILARVEEWRYINVLMNTEDDEESELIVSASLPRLGLNFHLSDGCLHSVEYPEYYISLNQSKGTLVGLRNSLLLEKDTTAEVNGKKQLILVPHGVIGNDRKDCFHHVTMIRSDDTLRQPPFFVYEVDHVLNRLKADKNKSAWLYLAALHGATSSCLPDPLTGLTGTEMAVWILQSGLVWSCAPYDFECKRTLQMIQSFSPLRDYYPLNRQQMELVTWLPSFPSYAAYDGYELLVQKLLQDSERLQELFPLQNKWTAIDPDLHSHEHRNKFLRFRGYQRHQYMYNPCAHLNEKFLPSDISETWSKKCQTTVITRRTEMTSVLQEISLVRRNSQQFPNYCFSPPYAELYLFLMTPELLDGSLNSMEVVHGTIRSWMSLNLRRDWLRIYSLALTADDQSLHNHLTMILCTLAYYQRESRAQLLNIHFISRFRKERMFPPPVCSTLPYLPTNHDFRLDQIQNLLCSSAEPFSGVVPVSPTQHQSMNRKQQQQMHDMYLATYKKAVETEAVELANGIMRVVTSPTFMIPYLHQYLVNYLNLNPQAKLRPFAVHIEMQTLILEWFRNLQLKNFVIQVQQQLESVYVDIRKVGNYICLKLDQLGVKINVKTITDKPLGLTLATYFHPEKISCKNVPTEIYTSGKLQGSLELLASDFMDKRIPLFSTKEAIFQELKQSILSNELSKCLNMCGMFPRLVPVYLFGKLVTEKATLPEEILDHIGGIAVLQTHIMRMNRCIKYELEGPQMATELEREIVNKGHENWSPKENPEWLLLELDLDIMIRPIQVEVARQMISMPDEHNGVMQLNMGEGKTSLIVPMLASTLADKETLCRVTVLNSIFKTNLDLLSNAIGGLLSRRVYLVPCRRDAKIQGCLPRIWGVYRECVESLGVVLTLAEYRLSPRLMAYEKLLGNKDDAVSFGLDLLELEDWLRDHCRDVLDESDELLSAKYQLIYTTGAQLPLGGGTMRWLTCQSILRLVPDVLYKLWTAHGDQVVEFDMEKYENYPEQFPPCRLLGDVAQSEFYSLLAEQILDGTSDLIDIILSDEDYKTTKRFLTEPEVTKDVHEAVLSIFKDDVERLERILLISGYLRRGILHLALCKRWRVEYGVDSKGRRQMAVPFRAKDVAAERTEFGHPDVGIVLTHLSYYYSGLKDEQLMETFMVLKSAPGPETIYQEWLMEIPPERLYPSIRNFSGVNLRDFKQRTVHLFPVLRKNKRVIDFWLSNKVFPKESKQFPRKIVTTAWDLCYERNKLPTTGFSGTNDCSILLPYPIKQQDLPQLQETNRKMEDILKRPENSNVVPLAIGITCRDILERVKNDKARVLIDAGALMLELGNEQVARLWLETDGEIDGVVYFNDRNELLVKVRASGFASSSAMGRRRQRRAKFVAADIPLEVSPYRERLDKCGIFLDDQHTRGTDLKFPNGFRGCVTVGSRMKRDKLIQAAMRMRKLGSGHSVSFYLSHEVSNKVQQQVLGYSNSKINMNINILTEDILKWVTSNSEQFEKDGLIYWAMAGKNYAQKLAAEDVFHHTVKVNPTLKTGRRLKNASVLGNHCVDEEMVDLIEMYGSYLKHENLVELLAKWFLLRKQKLEDDSPLPGSVGKVYDDISAAVVGKCREHIPDKTYLANNFDEEQEKELELEPEHEEIRCLIRHKSLKPWEPSLGQEVRDFVLSGRILPKSKSSMLVRLGDIFSDTSFFSLIQSDCWNCDIFVSPDFTRVIKAKAQDKLDNYLRPIGYIASMKPKDKKKGNKGTVSTYLLLISAYEANELLNCFKSGQVHPDVKLHMFSTRCFYGQDILINNPYLQLPSESTPHLIEDEMIVPLLLASGSLFFGTMAEQRAYAWFLGFIPRLWTRSVEQVALSRGWILKTGFLLPRFAKPYEQLIREHAEYNKENEEGNEETYREQENLTASALNFEEDPSSMVKAILENRHISVRDSAHVLQLLSKCAFVPLPEEKEQKVEEGSLSLLFRNGLKISDKM